MYPMHLATKYLTIKQTLIWSIREMTVSLPWNWFFSEKSVHRFLFIKELEAGEHSEAFGSLRALSAEKISHCRMNSYKNYNWTESRHCSKYKHTQRSHRSRAFSSLCGPAVWLVRQVSADWNQKPGSLKKMEYFQHCVSLSVRAWVCEIEKPRVREWPTFIFSPQVPSESCDPPSSHWSLLPFLPSSLSLSHNHIASLFPSLQSEAKQSHSDTGGTQGWGR